MFLAYMEIKFIREYAARISEVFADRALYAKNRGENEDYIKYLEDRRDLWEKVVHLSVNSEKWEIVEDYISLMSTPKVSKNELRRQYKFLQEEISNTNLNNSKKIQNKNTA